MDNTLIIDSGLPTSEATPVKTPLEIIEEKQDNWTKIVKGLSAKLKNFAELPELMNEVYAKRQDATDYYFSLLHKISLATKKYNEDYATIYNKLKVESQIRYTSEAAINAQIASILSDPAFKLSLMNNHAKFMQETIKSIDNLIFGINNRIKIEELIEGIKK